MQDQLLEILYSKPWRNAKTNNSIIFPRSYDNLQIDLQIVATEDNLNYERRQYKAPSQNTFTSYYVLTFDLKKSVQFTRYSKLNQTKLIKNKTILQKVLVNYYLRQTITSLFQFYSFYLFCFLLFFIIFEALAALSYLRKISSIFKISFQINT